MHEIGLSEHMEAEIRYVHMRHIDPETHPQLGPDDPVPMCRCPACGGMASAPRRKNRQRRRSDRIHRLPVEEARQVDLLVVCRRLGISVRRMGKNWRGDCPFHESRSHTSFCISPDKGLWWCFSCSIGGDAIRLWSLARAVDFKTAVLQVSEGLLTERLENTELLILKNRHGPQIPIPVQLNTGTLRFTEIETDDRRDWSNR